MILLGWGDGDGDVIKGPLLRPFFCLNLFKRGRCTAWLEWLQWFFSGCTDERDCYGGRCDFGGGERDAA